jgi:phosphoserine aminotransferase
MLILSPARRQRLETHTPPGRCPRSSADQGRETRRRDFEGETINTPSMLAVEDYIDALEWGRSIGGLAALMARADANAAVIHDWVARTPWAATCPVIHGPLEHSVCLGSPTRTCWRGPEAGARLQRACGERSTGGGRLRHRRLSRRPAGLRIWCGATSSAPTSKR